MISKMLCEACPPKLMITNYFPHQGDPVRIFVFRNSCLCRNFFPALFSFKKVFILPIIAIAVTDIGMTNNLQILFLLVLLLPVLGTALSLVLADNTTQVVFK